MGKNDGSKGFKKALIILSLVVVGGIGTFSFINAGHGNESYKWSPIFEDRLNTTLEAWERQGKVIELAQTRPVLDDNSAEKAKKIIRGLIGEAQQQAPEKTQDPNDPRCLKEETKDPDDPRCTPTVNPNDLKCRETLDPENPDCAETLDPNDPDCAKKITRDPDDVRCFTFNPKEKDCKKRVTKDPNNPQCKVTLDSDVPLCRETLDPDEPDCAATLDPSAGCNPTKDPADSRCVTLDPNNPDCKVTFDPRDVRCQITLGSRRCKVYTYA